MSAESSSQAKAAKPATVGEVINKMLHTYTNSFMRGAKDAAGNHYYLAIENKDSLPVQSTQDILDKSTSKTKKVKELGNIAGEVNMLTEHIFSATVKELESIDFPADGSSIAAVQTAQPDSYIAFVFRYIASGVNFNPSVDIEQSLSTRQTYDVMKMIKDKSNKFSIASDALLLALAQYFVAFFKGVALQMAGQLLARSSCKATKSEFMAALMSNTIAMTSAQGRFVTPIDDLNRLILAEKRKNEITAAVKNRADNDPALMQQLADMINKQSAAK
jgi:hypothetical protein